MKGENVTNIFDDLLGTSRTSKGKDAKEYRCVSCKYPMELVLAKTLDDIIARKLFYCKRSKCKRFGFVTVVVLKT